MSILLCVEKGARVSHGWLVFTDTSKFTFSLGKETAAERFFYPGTRSKVRQFAAYTAIDLVRRRLLGLKPLSL